MSEEILVDGYEDVEFEEKVDVYEANNLPYSVEELSIKELPPIPEWFTEALNEAGGMTGDKPNVRVVSGLDPELVEFYGGRWWKKYAWRVHDHKVYIIWHRQGKPDKILTPKEAEVIAKSKNKEGILIPHVDRQVKEFGIPRYFIELYKSPQFFGSAEAWEQIRYDKDENGKWFDLMGEFPHEGLYEVWFCIEEAVLDNDGKIVGTKFRELDETVLNLIKFKIEDIRGKTLAMQHEALRKEIDEEYTKNIEEGKQNIRDIVSDRIDRLVETPKVTVPSNYEHSNKT